AHDKAIMAAISSGNGLRILTNQAPNILFTRPVVFVISIARIRNRETAVRARRNLNVIHRSFVRNSGLSSSSNSQVRDELLGGIVVRSVNRVVQLPEVFESRRFLERLKGSNRSAFFRAVVHHVHAR